MCVVMALLMLNCDVACAVITKRRLSQGFLRTNRQVCCLYFLVRVSCFCGLPWLSRYAKQFLGVDCGVCGAEPAMRGR